MGLYFRKSVRFGPFRVNFSGAGIGISAGIPGFRFGSGPRGNYVQIGAHGIYYRAALPSGRSLTPKAETPVNRLPSQRDPIIPDNTLGAFETIESNEAGTITDSSSEALLGEIRDKQKLMRLFPWTLAAAFILAGGGLAYGLPAWAPLTLGLSLSIASLFVYRWDLRRKLVLLHYDLQEDFGKIYQGLHDSGSRLAGASRTWHVNATAKVLDKKYHAGASASVRRKPSVLSTDQPPFMASNVNPVAVTFSNSKFYFFPDRLLIYGKSGAVGAVAYAHLQVEPSITRFIEEEGVPRDAKVVDRTWRFVNKKGGPDKRFKNNRELPICAYGELSLKSESGVSELLMTSHQGLEAEFAAVLRHIANIGPNVARHGVI
jgi:hypothetical protein